jgi:hypothetical protein
MVPRGWLPDDEWVEINSVKIDTPGKVEAHTDPYAMTPQEGAKCATGEGESATNANVAQTAATTEVKTDVVKQQAVRMMSREERQ